MPLDSILGPQVTSLIAYATAILTAFSLLYGFAKIAWARMSGRPFPDNRVTRALDALAELGSNLVGFANKVKRGDGAPLIPNPEVVARDATIAELRAALDRAAGSLPSLAPSTRADELPLPRPAAPDAITALRARTLTGREGFDAGQRQTLAPDVVAAARREGERGSVDVRALLALVVGLSVVVPLGVVVAGCPAVNRDPTIAPPPAPADAGATACHNGAPWRFTAGAWSQADRQCNRLATDASAVVCCLTPSALRPDASVHACVPMALCSPEVAR